MKQRSGIGILGGTFDPVHNAHINLASEVYQSLQLQTVKLIPCLVPVHRNVPHASPEQRLQMLELAIADQPGLSIDERELHRAEPSFMVHTLDTLRDEYGTEVPLFLILGMDAFNRLESWHDWQRLLKLAHLVVVDRPGNSKPSTGTIVGLITKHNTEDISQLKTKSAGCIYFQAVTQLDISATHIRKLRSENKSIRELCAAAVCDYIENNNLYR